MAYNSHYHNHQQQHKHEFNSSAEAADSELIDSNISYCYKLNNNTNTKFNHSNSINCINGSDNIININDENLFENGNHGTNLVDVHEQQAALMSYLINGGYSGAYGGGVGYGPHVLHQRMMNMMIMSAPNSTCCSPATTTTNMDSASPSPLVTPAMSPETVVDLDILTNYDNMFGSNNSSAANSSGAANIGGGSGHHSYDASEHHHWSDDNNFLSWKFPEPSSVAPPLTPTFQKQQDFQQQQQQQRQRHQQQQSNVISVNPNVSVNINPNASVNPNCSVTPTSAAQLNTNIISVNTQQQNNNNNHNRNIISSAEAMGQHQEQQNILSVNNCSVLQSTRASSIKFEHNPNPIMNAHFNPNANFNLHDHQNPNPNPSFKLHDNNHPLQPLRHAAAKLPTAISLKAGYGDHAAVATNSDSAFNVCQNPASMNMKMTETVDLLMDDELLDADGQRLSKNLISERRRRKKLNEVLYSLRAVVPKISKLDKASIVCDAISYIRDLQGKVLDMQNDISSLQSSSTEGSLNADQAGSSAMAAANSESENDHESSPATNNNNSIEPTTHKLLQLDVTRMEELTYQVKINCVNSPGVIVQLTRAVEAMEFEVINAILTIVNDHILNIIIIKVEGDGTMALEVETLRGTILLTLSKFGLVED